MGGRRGREGGRGKSTDGVSFTDGISFTDGVSFTDGDTNFKLNDVTHNCTENYVITIEYFDYFNCTEIRDWVDTLCSREE